MRRRLALLLTAWIAGAIAASAAQGQDANDAPEIDYLEIGARLVADGNYIRAASALRKVDVNAKGLDIARYHTLHGLVALRQADPRLAIKALSAGIAAYQAKPENRRAEGNLYAERLAYVYLAQAHFQLAHYKHTLNALTRAGPVGAGIAALIVLRAESHWQLGDRVSAFAALARGAARFPADPQFLRRKIFYLMDLGFFIHAAKLGERYLEVAQAGVQDYLAIGSALRKSGQIDFALTILERARLRYPYDRGINIELAHAYLDAGKLTVAADLFARAAVHHRDILAEAAELERRAGHLYRALLLNTWINDQKRKLKQRLAILVVMERWAMAASMGAALARTGLLDQEDIRYAWAYTLFKAGDYQAAERALAPLERGDLFDKSVELRRAMEICRQARWRCL